MRHQEAVYQRLSIMRKILFIVVLLSVFSCEKHTDTFCYECQAKFKCPENIYCLSDVITVCEMTTASIIDYENELRYQMFKITGEVCEVECKQRHSINLKTKRDEKIKSFICIGR